MRELNVVGIEASAGFCVFHLLEGDITGLQEPVDVLIASAFVGSYAPTPGTVFAALREKHGVDVRELARDAEYDFRRSLGVWVSKQQAGGVFSRLLCVELIGAAQPISEILNNAFAALTLLEAKGEEIGRVAMPVLGAGSQGLDSDQMISLLLTQSKRYAERSRSLREVLFVEVDSARATALASAMDDVLGRRRVLLPKSELLSAMRKETMAALDQLQLRYPRQHDDLFAAWRALLEQEDIRSVELGIQSRKLVETLVAMLLPGRARDRLVDRIRAIENAGQVAPWICGYMNVLRHFGNESAHEKPPSERQPPSVEEGDLALTLLCVERLLEYWHDWAAKVQST
jgi:hypothetical protein